MQAGGTTMRALFSSRIWLKTPSIQCTAGVKSFTPPKSFTDIEYPERKKLKVMLKVPQYPPSISPFTMQKKLKLMRGPELYHNTLLHKQYGIIATAGGRVKYNHMEVIRYTLLRTVFAQNKDAFAIWRIPGPWQPISQRSLGSRLGGGKADIKFYVTPVKAGQVLVEVGGPFEYFEVKKVLADIANKMPFAARAVSQEILDTIAARKKQIEVENQNPFTWKYIIQNNMLGCHRWISKYDRRWFNEYM
ncbi:large ribosomal subunit protein uL16m [Nomia melanderi]|uniref:large ribosomal subunit protein uL16m n=1 Tax=Nomia melanderi TaxID=2448451 RepID=UPI0013042FFC|nr:39S ribosomal protein L16, mitochondrial [Nomia melanderi]